MTVIPPHRLAVARSGLPLLLAAVIAGAPRAGDAQPRRFDLVCTGVWSADDRPEGPWRGRFSVDLAQGRYCQWINGLCRMQPMSDVSRRTLVFHAVEASDEATRETLDRATSRYSRDMQLPLTGEWVKTSGRCKRARFTAPRTPASMATPG